MIEKKVAIWMDYAEALIGRREEDRVAVEKISSGIEFHLREEGQTADRTRFTPFHVSNNEHRNQHREQEQVKKYWKNLSEKLAGAEGVYLMGPGEAKREFARYMEEHIKNSPKVLALENSERLTENQLLAKMRQILLS